MLRLFDLCSAWLLCPLCIDIFKSGFYPVESRDAQGPLLIQSPAGCTLYPSMGLSPSLSVP